MSASSASLESFVRKTLKDEQIECIRRIVCYGRDFLAVLPTGFGKSSIYQLIPKVLFHMGCTANNATSKTIVAVFSPLQYIRKQQVAFEKIDCGICVAVIGNQSMETARSKIESSKLCLEVPNNGLAIDGEELCSLALLIRQRSRLSMKSLCRF